VSISSVYLYTLYISSSYPRPSSIQHPVPLSSPLIPFPLSSRTQALRILPPLSNARSIHIEEERDRDHARPHARDDGARPVHLQPVVHWVHEEREDGCEHGAQECVRLELLVGCLGFVGGGAGRGIGRGIFGGPTATAEAP